MEGFFMKKRLVFSFLHRLAMCCDRERVRQLSRQGISSLVPSLLQAKLRYHLFLLEMPVVWFLSLEWQELVAIFNAEYELMLSSSAESSK